MTVADIFAHVVAHGFTDTSTPLKEQALNAAVREVEEYADWPYLDIVADHTWNAGSSTPTSQPTRMSAVISIINATTGVVLQPQKLSTLHKNFPTALTNTGEPIVYYFTGTTLGVYPVPAASTILKVAYVRYQAALVTASTEADILLPARFHHVYVLGMLKVLFGQEFDFQNSEYWQGQLDAYLERMTYRLFMQNLDRPDRFVPYVDDYDDVDW